MASKFLLLLIFMLSYHAHAKEDATVETERLKAISDCEDSFDCDSEKIIKDPLSLNLGSFSVNIAGHNLSKNDECPIASMNQYLKDCKSAWGVVDSTREAIADKEEGCDKLNSALSNEALEEELRKKFGFNEDIPRVTQCLDRIFTTEPFDNTPIFSELKTLPTDQHQAFIAEYYSNAHRLKQRMKSQINNIHSIDRILGPDKSETPLDCGGHKTCDEDDEGCIEGEIISGLKSECETLQRCSLNENKEELEENQNQLAKKTIYSLQAYYMNADKIKKILDECVKSKPGPGPGMHPSAMPGFYIALGKLCETEFEKELTPLREVEAGYLAMHPWIRSSKFTGKFKNEEIKNKIKELDLSEKGNYKNIPNDLIEQVKKSMVDHLTETREFLVKEMPRTNKTYNCLVKNEKCEDIKGGLFNSDGSKRSNINAVLNTSPPIANVDEVPDLIPHFENLQCRQEKRINQEAKQEFAKWAALDVGILVGSVLLSPFTFGGSGVTALSLVGARFTRGLQVVYKANQLKKAEKFAKAGETVVKSGRGAKIATTGIGGAEIFASGALLEEVSAECKDNFATKLNNLGLEKESIQLEVALDEKNNSNKTDTNIDQCQVIKKYADIESNMKNCIFQYMLAGAGIALPVGIFLKQLKVKNIAKGPTSPKNPPPTTSTKTLNNTGGVFRKSAQIIRRLRRGAKTGESLSEASSVRKKGDKGDVAETNPQGEDSEQGRRMIGTPGAAETVKIDRSPRQSGVTASGGKSGTEVIGTHVRTGGSSKQGGKPRSPMADKLENQFEVIETQVVRAVKTGGSSKQLGKRVGEVLKRDKKVSQIRMSKDKDTLLTFKRTDDFRTSLYRVDRKGNIHKLSDDNLNKSLLTQHRVPLKNSSLAGLNKRVKKVRKGAARLKRGQTPKETPDTVGKNVSPTIKNSQVAAAARSVNNSDSVAPVVQNTMQKYPLVAAASRGVTRAGRLLSQYNKSGRQIAQPTARLNEKANRATASISDDKKGALVVGGSVVGGAAAVNKQVKVNSLDDCSKVKKGSYGYQICALQSRIAHLNEKIAQAHVISQRLSLYLWSGVRHSAISPYFISELEIFLKNKKLATVEYQHLSRYMKNISIIQNRIDENPNREAQNKMDQLLTNFDQYIRNPAQQNLDNSQNLREEISLLDQLTRNS